MVVKYFEYTAKFDHGLFPSTSTFLAVYFTLIYFPLVIIFCCARVLAPGLDQTPDRIMPVMSFLLTAGAHLVAVTARQRQLAVGQLRKLVDFASLLDQIGVQFAEIPPIGLSDHEFDKSCEALLV